MSKPLESWRGVTVPDPVKTEMEALRQGLDAVIPRKRDVSRNLLIATWNIKAFSSLTEKWLADGADSPKRDWRALWAITEIVSRFDVIAIQEIKGDLKALRTMMKTLGPTWNFLITDITMGNSGNSERMGYIFDTSRVNLSGLAGELVIPEEEDGIIGTGALTRQFARTPFAVSFRAGNDTFILTSLHVDFGSSSAGRIPELKGIAEWLHAWAGRATAFGQNFIALGDFNVDRRGDALWEAFTSTGLEVPAELHDVRRSIFADSDNTQLEKYYDQIAWFTSGGKRQLNLEYVTAGGFDFVSHIYTETGFTKSAIQHRLSDHYPLWAEFNCQQ